MKRIIVISLTILILQACGSKETIPMKCNIYVRYEQDNKLLKGEATFYTENEDGSKTQIALDKSVAFMGSNMPFSDKILRYQTERKIDLPEQVTINWKGGDKYESTINIETSKVGLFKVRQIDEQSVIDIDAAALGKNELLTILFDGSNGEKTNIDVKGPTTSSTIPITDEAVLRILENPVKISLVRSKTYYEEQDNCTCTVTQSYYSKWLDM